MKDLRELQHKAKGNNKKGNNFKGIPMMCAPGLHEKAFEILENCNIDKDSPILILGAGAGAFDKRLLVNGYTNITSIEFVEGIHRVEGVKLLNNDLNKDFSYIGKFKVIIALEIIEHLENQFHFIREIKKMLLDRDSILILSTPNCENSFSRIRFFITGYLSYFGKKDLENTGHINPVFHHILKLFLNNTDLKIIKIDYNQNVWKDLIFSGKLSRSIISIFLYPIKFLQKKPNDGQINIYLIKSI